MDKRIIPIIIAGIILFLVLLPSMGLFSTMGMGDFNVARDCATATASHTRGAQQGECFMAGISGDTKIAYVESVVEKTGTCKIGLNCPDGVTYSCQIRSNLNWEDIFTCDVVHTSSGDVQVCKYDSDCPNGKCTNAMCQGYSNECDYEGQTRCMSETKYEKCLGSGRYSGLLTCPTGTTCYVDRCRTPSEIAALNIQSPEGGEEPEAPISTTTIIIGGSALAGLLVASKLLGK